MKTIDIKIGKEDKNCHKCDSRMDGDWIVYTCPRCPGYERRINQYTNEMTVKWGAGKFFEHTGIWIPVAKEMN